MTYLPLARANDLVLQEIASETLAYDPQTNQAFCLNSTLNLVFKACDGKTTFAQLEARHGLTEDVILLALDELSRAGLLEPGQSYASPLANLSRREAIAGIVAASGIVLPAIFSNLVPAPAQAASLLPLLANCSSNEQCASNFCTNGPPRCCVPGTQGIRNAFVCCTIGVDCDTSCCVGAVPVSTGNATCASIGRNGAISCP